MPANAKGIGVGVLVVLVLLVWLVFLQGPSTSAQLASDLANGKLPQVPEFGTDNIIDAADAIAMTGSLPLPSLTLSASTRSMNSSQ